VASLRQPLAHAPILQATIANGTSLSGGVEIGAGTLVGLDLPVLTSAALSLQASADGVTWREGFNADGTTATSVGVSTGDRFVAAPAALAGVAWLKVRSGTSGAPVNQGADRVISLIVQ
jgi:hypothetical protein